MNISTNDRARASAWPVRAFFLALVIGMLIASAPACSGCGDDASDDPANGADDDTADDDANDDDLGDDDNSPDDDASDDDGADDDIADDDSADDDFADDDMSDDDSGDDDAADDDMADDDTADDDTGDDDTGDDDANCPEVTGNLAEPSTQFVPAGTFDMGSPDTESGRLDYETQHQVTLTRAMRVMTYEVTQSLWKGVMGDTPPFQVKCGDNYPVGTVTWYDAVEFANALSAALGYDACYTENRDGTYSWDVDCDGFRLPTEAEWEYFARAGSTTAFTNGEITEGNCADPLLALVGWYCGNSGFTIHEVGGLAANAFGLHDVHGNLWEWVWDSWFEEFGYIYADGPATDPAGEEGDLIFIYRGGSMFATSINNRLAYRRPSLPTHLDEDNGLRLVRTVIPD